MKKSTASLRPLIKDIQALQDMLDYRSSQIQIAIDLMSQMKYDEAESVLSHLDYLTLEDFK